jgi:hypothetical protein
MSIMPVSRLSLLLLTFGLAALFAASALAADPAQHACLSKAEQRAAVATHKARPLAEIVKSRRQHGYHGELVRARLCQRDAGLVYVLTLLGLSGKVFTSIVDAATGEAINAR